MTSTEGPIDPKSYFSPSVSTPVPSTEGSLSLLNAEAIAAAAQEGVDVFESKVLSLSWLLDSGSGYDLLSRHLLSSYRQYVKQLRRALNFDTANGRSKATEVASMTISEMGDVSARPVLMESCPPVLSMGMRVVDEYFGHYWQPGERYSILIHPDEEAVTLPQIEKLLPTISSETPHYKLDSADDILSLAERVGAHICTCDGSPQLCLPILMNNTYLREAAQQTNWLAPSTSFGDCDTKCPVLDTIFSHGHDGSDTVLPVFLTNSSICHDATPALVFWTTQQAQ